MRGVDVETVLRGRCQPRGVVALLTAATLTITACGGTGTLTDPPAATAGHLPRDGQQGGAHEPAAPHTPQAPEDHAPASPDVAQAPEETVTIDLHGTEQVDVRDFGAVGDGASDDTEAIQRANDAVAAQGGGRVFIPRGTYLVRTITQDSEVEIRGEEGTVLKRADGRSKQGLVLNRVGRTGGSVEQGSGVLNVRDVSSVLPGVPVAVADAETPLVALPGLGSDRRVHYALAVGVSGNRVWLDRPPPSGFRDVDLYIGTIRTTLAGLTLDDTRPAAPSASSVAVRYALARWARISDSVIRGGAVSLGLGSRDSVIERNVLMDIGRPSERLGAAVWLFRGSSNNVVQDNVIGGDSFIGVAIDDRTAEATKWDAPSNGNLIRRNLIEIPDNGNRNAGVIIEGSSHNEVSENTFRLSFYGVRVLAGSASSDYSPQANRVEGNEFTVHQLGIEVTSRYNSIVGNRADGVVRFIRDAGEGNYFADNQ